MLPVHPHVCGELYVNDILTWTKTGSSPRLWGTPIARGTDLPKRRFIPTSVGNSDNYRIRCAGYAVHPHVCGELAKRNRRYYPDIGSSPRLWGTLHAKYSAAEMNARRFIPTSVGNSSKRFVLVRQTLNGSSPRLWGTHSQGKYPGCRCRFIPTSVGNSHRFRWAILFNAVHPHVCGELSFLSGSWI